MKKSKRILMIFCLFYFLLFPHSIYAYIDPGTGSYIIQLLIAAFIGLSIGVKIFWKKIKTFFVNIFQNRQQDK